MTAEPGPREEQAGRRGLGARLSSASFVLGSLGLLGAMLVDAAAVVGRHTSLPLLGSIEVVEACVVCLASASLVGTTLERGHASVHVFTERLSEAPRRRLARASELLGALFFTVLAGGSMVVAADLWSGRERSELLGIPMAPLRLLWCASALGVAVTFLARALARRSRA